jgi:hypothetical protein
LISFFGLLINWLNRADARRAKREAVKGEEKLKHDVAIQTAIIDLERRINTRLNERAFRNLGFQLSTSLVLFLMIAGIGSYLWIVTARIESAIQPDQMKAAISDAHKAAPPNQNAPAVKQKTSRLAPKQKKHQPAQEVVPPSKDNDSTIPQP